MASGGFRVLVFGWRVALTSASRVLIWAAAAIAVRHVFAPRPPIYLDLPARIVGWFAGPNAIPFLHRLVVSAKAPLRSGETALFGFAQEKRWSIVEAVAVLLGFSLLVAIFTWPQLRHMDSVPDPGDPLFSIWRLAWINHQLPRHPAALFDANIFYPERLTLTYSDAVLVPWVMSAPLFWIGLQRIHIYNVLFLSAFVLSGASMYLLVRSLTGRRDAAVVAGVVFTLHPFRLEHYSHLELQMAMWMPLALWALHRTMARARLVDGLTVGVGFALQMLSSLYYGEFFIPYLVAIGLALWIGRRFPMRPLAMLAAGGALAALVVAPVASRYVANRSQIGERHVGMVEDFSATGSDYLKPHVRNAVYTKWSGGGFQERQLFPHVTPVVLALAGAWPPLSIGTIAYTAALAVSIDGSFGMNGLLFPWLREHVAGFRALRAPARFSMLVGMTLAVLSGYGAARILTRWPRARPALVAAMIAPILLESIPHITLEPVWREPPAIYAALAGQSPPGVLAEFPTPVSTGMIGSDTRYLYFSTFHWQTLVNGYSGYVPASYTEFLDRTGDFPSAASLSYLRRRGVQYITWHGAFSNPVRHRRTIAMLDASPDVELVAKAPWEGSESALYRLH